jgi:hypothetical protein
VNLHNSPNLSIKDPAVSRPQWTDTNLEEVLPHS